MSADPKDIEALNELINDLETPKEPVVRTPVLKPLGKTVGTAVEIAQRRRKVQQFRLRGYSYHEMANELGVTIGTIHKDLKVIQKENAAKVKPEEHERITNEALDTYDQVMQRAWDEFNAAAPGSKVRMSALEAV